MSTNELYTVSVRLSLDTVRQLLRGEINIIWCDFIALLQVSVGDGNDMRGGRYNMFGS